MYAAIYISIVTGLILGWLIKGHGLRKYSEKCLSILIYILVFLVGVSSGSIELPTTSSFYSISTIVRVTLLIGTLAVLPTFLSIIIATILLGMRRE